MATKCVLLFSLLLLLLLGCNAARPAAGEARAVAANKDKVHVDYIYGSEDKVKAPGKVHADYMYRDIGAGPEEAPGKVHVDYMYRDIGAGPEEAPGKVHVEYIYGVHP